MTQRVQVIDLFSGCGGVSYGFARAETTNVSYEVLGGLDTDIHANATYKKMIGVEALHRDVSDLLDEELEDSVSRWGLDASEPLLLIGCAPCQGFSSHRKKDARTDVRNSLVSKFGQAVLRLRPEVVVMENVPEILQAKNWAIYAHWKRTLEKVGYTVRARIYNLAQFGVPQDRFRTLVIAMRDRNFFEMPQPLLRPSAYKTVRESIGHLPPLHAGETNPDDPMHVTSKHREATVDLLRLIPADGGSRRDLPADHGPSCLTKVDGFRDVYGRMFWDRPANAITARCRTPSTGRFAHPEQHRGLSVREAALLQGFPPDFYFEGPFDDKFKQIGNAVSPIFSAALASHLDEQWFAEHERGIDRSEDVTKPIAKSISSALASIKRRMREANLLHVPSFGVVE